MTADQPGTAGALRSSTPFLMKTIGSSQVASAVTSQTISGARIHVSTTGAPMLEAVDERLDDQQRDERRDDADAAEERGGVPVRHLHDERREHALQHGEDHDGEREAPPVRPVDREPGQHPVGDDQAEGRREQEDEAAQQEHDHVPSVARTAGHAGPGAPVRSRSAGQETHAVHLGARRGRASSTSRYSASAASRMATPIISAASSRCTRTSFDPRGADRSAPGPPTRRRTPPRPRRPDTRSAAGASTGGAAVARANTITSGEKERGDDRGFLVHLDQLIEREVQEGPGDERPRPPRRPTQRSLDTCNVGCDERDHGEQDGRIPGGQIPLVVHVEPEPGELGGPVDVAFVGTGHGSRVRRRRRSRARRARPGPGAIDAGAWRGR